LAIPTSQSAGFVLKQGERALKKCSKGAARSHVCLSGKRPMFMANSDGGKGLNGVSRQGAEKEAVWLAKGGRNSLFRGQWRSSSCNPFGGS